MEYEDTVALNVTKNKDQAKRSPVFSPSDIDGMTRMRASFTWCLSFPDASCVVSLEGLPWNFFRNSTVVWDDYRHSPFLRDGTVFRSRTSYSPGPSWGDVQLVLLITYQILRDLRTTGLRALVQDEE